MTSTLTPINGEDFQSVDWRALVDRFYADNAEAEHVLVEHSRAVAAMANEINRVKHLGLPDEVVTAAAMLHDIGIVATDAPGIGCRGTEPYIRHGVVGADMLRQAGAPEWCARVAERHTGAGLTADDIERQNLPLPTDRILVPQSTLEKLICYADKFYSKRPGELSQRKSTERVVSEMARHGHDTAIRFERLHSLFGR